MRASREVAKLSRRRTWRARLTAGLLTGTAAVLLHSASAGAAGTTTPAAAAPAKAPVKTTPAATAKGTKTTAAVAAASGARTVRLSTPNAAVAAKPSAVTPGRNPGKGLGVQNAPSLEQQIAYQYNALGRRDPFAPMAGGTFVGEDVGGDAPPDVGGIRVVGIVWGASDKFALVEDARGTSRVLRAGDKVMNGVVETLKRDAVIVNLTVDGQSEHITIPLTRKGDQTNANR